MASENSIQHFKSNFLKNGLARPTRYKVELFGPDDSLTFQPEAVALPARAFVSVQDDLFFGPARRQPIGQDFTGQVVLTFPVADDQGERTFFEAWMDKIVHPNTQEARYMDGAGEVYGSMTIVTLNSAGEESSAYQFEEVYPATIMPTQLSYGERDSYTRLTVAMEFRRYSYDGFSSGYFTFG